MKGSASALTVHPYFIDFSPLYERADAISKAYHSHNLVFFLGSGASRAFGSSMPNWNELLINLLSEIRTGNQEQREEISRLIKDRRYLLAAEAIKQFGVFDTENRDLAVDLLVAKILTQRMKILEKNPILHLAILDFSVPILTTNYDSIVESLIAEYEVECYRRTAITYEDEDDASMLLSPTRKPENYVFKLHGSVDRTQRLILDERDYSDFYFKARWPTSLQLLRHTLATKMVLFIGFSLSDPDIMQILREATRYASSYQHIALMYGPEITCIEKEVMRSNYRVDPILYEQHSHLPLYVMEMRNFYYREDTALQLKPEKNSLVQALAEIKKEEVQLQRNCSTILFGSFAKYGNLLQPGADVDVLFLTDHPVGKSRLHSVTASEKLGRRIDATVMKYSEFERLLRCGDPFASSILVTGCPLEDTNDRYGILCRGFRGRYAYKSVLENMLDRYRMRWLRLCVLRGAGLQEYLQACHQWSITLMQLFIIRSHYPLDSLLAASLLGNARYTIREFARRFENVDEEFFVSIMRTAKGILPPDEVVRASIKEMRQGFLDIFHDRYTEDDLEMLLPGEFVQQADVSRIVDVYQKLSSALDALTRGETVIGFGYGSVDAGESLLEKLAEVRKVSERRITTFDWLFFFRLHELATEEDILAETREERLVQVCHSVRDQWLEEIVSG